MTTYLLVPSPLLGAATWQPVASHLHRRGRAAVVVDVGDAQTADDVVGAVVDAARGLEDVVLVPHSNAGYVTPHLAERLDARASVHVDAALPSPTGSRASLAPAGLLDRLRALADDDGVLPAWSDWWTPEDLAAVLPDDDLWAPVASDQPRLPLGYFTSEVAVPTGWVERPNAYLAFGGTYADEVAAARAHGWPVACLDAGHLHLLREPAEVADVVVDLVRRLGVTA